MAHEPDSPPNKSTANTAPNNDAETDEFAQKIVEEAFAANAGDDEDDNPNNDAENTDNTVPFADATTAALDAENARLRDAAARALADLDNYRRRATREKEELRKYATQGILEDLIPILDNFQMGLDAANKHPEAAPVTNGFKMIFTQIKNLLEQNGLSEINPTEQAFDPNFHESVGVTPHPTIPDHHVAAVLRVGYRLQDRLVRPASVLLSSGKPNPETDTTSAATTSAAK